MCSVDKTALEMAYCVMNNSPKAEDGVVISYRDPTVLYRQIIFHGMRAALYHCMKVSR